MLLLLTFLQVLQLEIYDTNHTINNINVCVDVCVHKCKARCILVINGTNHILFMSVVVRVYTNENHI
jgi:hypothetical protein